MRQILLLLLLWPVMVYSQDEVSEARYLAGAVPEVEGQIVFTADIATTLPVEDVYNKVYSCLQTLAGESCQTDKSVVTAMSDGEHTVVGRFIETLTFYRKALALDQATFHYTVIATCSEGAVTVTIERLSYDYAFSRDIEHVAAEEVISDAKMLSADGSKMKRYNSRFRRATVDRMDAIIDRIRVAVQE